MVSTAPVHQALATTSPSPSPVPTTSPLVHAAMPVIHHAANLSVATNLWTWLNTWAAGVSEAAVVGAVLVGLQTLLNKLPWLQHDVKQVQYLIRLFVSVTLPFLGVLVYDLTSGQNTLHLAPVLFLAGQVVFAVGKFILSFSPQSANKDLPTLTEA